MAEKGDVDLYKHSKVVNPRKRHWDLRPAEAGIQKHPGCWIKSGMTPEGLFEGLSILFMNESYFSETINQ